MSSYLFTIGVVDNDVLDIHTIVNAYAVILKIPNQRQNHTLILVVLGKTQRSKVRQTVNMVTESAQIALHLKSRGPSLERKHGLPIKPEVSVPERIRKYVTNLLALKVLLGSHKQLSKRK